MAAVQRCERPACCADFGREQNPSSLPVRNGRRQQILQRIQRKATVDELCWSARWNRELPISLVGQDREFIVVARKSHQLCLRALNIPILQLIALPARAPDAEQHNLVVPDGFGCAQPIDCLLPKVNRKDVDALA
jgi:hypothetical protein